MTLMDDLREKAAKGTKITSEELEEARKEMAIGNAADAKEEKEENQKEEQKPEKAPPPPEPEPEKPIVFSFDEFVQKNLGTFNRVTRSVWRSNVTLLANMFLSIEIRNELKAIRRLLEVKQTTKPEELATGKEKPKRKPKK